MQGDASWLLHEFHSHRLGQEIEGGADWRRGGYGFRPICVTGNIGAVSLEIDALITGRALATGWSMDRFDRPMRALPSAAIMNCWRGRRRR
jgi:hypothetical protein